MPEDKTAILFEQNETSELQEITYRPTLFVCQSHSISEYRLQGHQTIGRPTEDDMPDIPVHDRFVSKNHGFFETEENQVYYTAQNTTNGIKYMGRLLKPWTKILLKDGDELVIPSDDNDSGHSVMLIYAVTASRINLWRELQKASNDKLTNLSGREGFMMWWDQNYERKDYADSVLFIMDIDDFKIINDKKGHNAGDEALTIVADQLRKTVRYETQVCRWGGDEFVGIIPGTRKHVYKRLEEMSTHISQATTTKGIPLTVSIGFVEINRLGNKHDISGIIEYADYALYQVKQDNKGGIKGFDFNTEVS
ncbi:MAG: GGDEF domain-containing protein [Lachnospiraceae bacterium]|nr:GGDEF domain-containing protein [Lachnospiraceae bacterium]